MAKLIYSAITSLDGYIEDEDGKFDWAVPDEEFQAGRWKTAPPCRRSGCRSFVWRRQPTRRSRRLRCA